MPREPGSEEYLDSEKYELRHWDLARPDSLADFIGRVNAARRDNPALQHDCELAFLPIDNDAADRYAKVDPTGDNAVVVIVNLDPHHTQSGWVTLDLAALGLEGERAFQVHDLLTGARLPVERDAQLRAARPGARAGPRVPAASARAHRARLRLLSLDLLDRMPATLPLFETTPATAPGPAPAADATPAPAPALVQGRGHLPAARQGLLRFERRRHRRLPRAHARSSTTSRISASTRSGCCRSIRRRCATTATTSPTTRTSTRPTARAPISSISCARRTGAGCASSPSSSSTTPPTSTRGSRRRGARRRARRSATTTSGATTRRQYAGTRIIFTDTEKSNWAWDDVAKAYYWHRFFSHQPDLNFDNPQVLQGDLPRDALLARHGRRRLPPRRDSLPRASARARTTRTCRRRTRC